MPNETTRIATAFSLGPCRAKGEVFQDAKAEYQGTLIHLEMGEDEADVWLPASLDELVTMIHAASKAGAGPLLLLSIPKVDKP